MAQQLDPWRTLGLSRGASAEEVRRAYRRLAKANHPDAAGEEAVPRFLAIQAAYEILIRPSVKRRAGGRPGSATSGSSAGSGEAGDPWRADPDRARASGRADGRRPGARPTGRTSAGQSATGTSSGAGEAAPGGPAAGAAGTGRTSAGSQPGGASARARRPSGRRRAPNKATPYSTSYDPGDEEAFEPGWGGAGWYGAASGTYWTINPKEYADPRKHGPEYQRRASRDTGAWIDDDRNVSWDEAPAGDSRAGSESQAASEPRAGSETAPDTNGEPARPDATWTEATAPLSSAASRPPGAETAAASGAGTQAPRPAVDWAAWLEPQPAGSRLRLRTLRTPSGWTGRVVIAFLGWVGLAAAGVTLLGEATGCSRFSASCDETAGPVSSVVMVALFALVLALPRVATWLAHGTIATLLVGIPTAVILSASGGAREPAASASVLGVVVVAAWIAGVGYALLVPRLAARDGPYHAGDEPPPRRQ